MRVKILNDIDDKIQRSDSIHLLNFGSVDRIDYKKQLSGSGKELVKLGRVSERLGGATLVGADSDNCGLLRKSVFIFNGGRLQAICDMNRAEDKYAPAFGYKTIDYLGKKIGILVDRDLYNPDAVKSLITCGVGAIIDLYEGLFTEKVKTACEFYAYVYGVDFIVCCKDKATAYNAYGEEISPLSNGVFGFECVGVYRESKCKKRGN